MTVDPPSLSIAEIVGIATLVSMILGGLIWLIRAVSQVRHETQPNSGTSMKDQLSRIERDIAGHRAEQREEARRLELQIVAVREDVQEVHGRVTAHMQWHLDHNEGKARTRSTD